MRGIPAHHGASVPIIQPFENGASASAGLLIYAEYTKLGTIEICSHSPCDCGLPAGICEPMSLISISPADIVEQTMA